MCERLQEADVPEENLCIEYIAGPRRGVGYL